MKKFLIVYLSALIVCFIFEYFNSTVFKAPTSTWNEPYPTICPKHHSNVKRLPQTYAALVIAKANYDDKEKVNTSLPPINASNITEFNGSNMSTKSLNTNNPKKIPTFERFFSLKDSQDTFLDANNYRIYYDIKGNLLAFEPTPFQQKNPKVEFTCRYDKFGNLFETAVKTDISYLVYNSKNELKLIKDIRR